MNPLEDKPKATRQRRPPGTSAILSIILPFFGFGLAVLVAHRGRQSWDALSDLITAFVIWSLFSLAGAISALVSFKRHGPTADSLWGLILCSPPLLYFLSIVVLNSQ